MASEHDGRGDFDFLFGRWTVSNQRLLRRLRGGDGPADALLGHRGPLR